jgi:hypothetical protein
MASNTDNGEHPYVSQDGVYVPSVTFRERFDVSKMAVMPTNATADTPPWKLSTVTMGILSPRQLAMRKRNNHLQNCLGVSLHLMRCQRMTVMPVFYKPVLL